MSADPAATVKDAAMSTNGPPLAELKGVSKHFGSVRALDDVDFALYPNEIHALVGDNGAGKSTLIKILSGAHQPTAGQVYVDGQPVVLEKPNDAFELGIVTLYQDLALVNCRSISHNIFLGQELTKLGVFIDSSRMNRESRELVESLGQVNIASVETEVEKLSGGQRQAVAISRIVHRGGRIVLLDEPTAALGVREAHEILNLIQSLKNKDRAIVIVSHNLAHVFRISDRITVLRGGKRAGTRMHADTDPDDIVKMITGADLL